MPDTSNPLAQVFILLPPSPEAWLGLVGLLLLLLAGIKRNWESATESNRKWPLLLGLFILIIPAVMVFRLALPNTLAFSVPGLPLEPQPPVVSPLAFLPWMLAAGFAGVQWGAGFALITGLIMAAVTTHNPFTPLEIGLLGLVFSMALRQRYRTPFYKILRNPLGAAFLLALVFAPLLMLTGFLFTKAGFAVRLDYALVRTYPAMLAQAGNLLAAGFLAELVFLLRRKDWGKKGSLLPSPAENSLQTRFGYATITFLATLILSLLLGDWVVAGNAARKSIEEQLSGIARVSAEGLPYFLETGQNLILKLATPDLISLSGDNLYNALGQRMRSVPYFRQLFLLNIDKKPVLGYPERNWDSIHPADTEIRALDYALQGVPVQTYTLVPLAKETSIQVSFIAQVLDAQGKVQGVLVGRTDFSTNPFTQPAIVALSTLSQKGGEGGIVDENGMLLYHTNNKLLMQKYAGGIPESALFFEETTPNANRRLVYYQPMLGKNWGVIVSLPAEQANQAALDIAVQLLLLLLGLSLAAYLFLRVVIRGVVGSIGELSVAATRIAEGQLSQTLPVRGVDEVSRLTWAFDQMRISLKARLDELDKLLKVSQGVASNLGIAEAVRPVLDAALGDKASAARVVFIQEVQQNFDYNHPVAFGVGVSSNAYAYLDAQLMDIMRTQEILPIPNMNRIRRLTCPPGYPQPGALIARALYHESTYYGVLWAAYDQMHTFAEEELSFLTTLAGQAALAAANARLYATAEIGRQRLAAVLASAPEPVMVIDEQMRLLLLNPAAMQIAGLVNSSTPGRPIGEVVANTDVLELILRPIEEKQTTREITLAKGRIYYASVAPVSVGDRLVGKICMLRDITHYKEIDTLKSEFVATVSHDLRKPLTSIHGYATMMQMVGELNEQQKGYIRKIMGGVDNMSRLINNLLDLGRIESGIKLNLDRFLLGEVIDQVLSGMQLDAARKTITLTRELPDSPVLIEADKLLIQQAINNLLDNAIKYTNTGGQVKIGLEIKPTRVVISVRDTGMGISPVDLPRVFEKFYRSARREAYIQPGTGLGLAIVKSIAERHGGNVWPESQLGRGSTFFIELPYRQTPG